MKCSMTSTKSSLFIHTVFASNLRVPGGELFIMYCLKYAWRNINAGSKNVLSLLIMQQVVTRTSRSPLMAKGICSKFVKKGNITEIKSSCLLEF
jgi:hypothetical protein